MSFLWRSIVKLNSLQFGREKELETIRGVIDRVSISFARRQGRTSARSPSSAGRITHTSTAVGSGLSTTMSAVTELSDSNSSTQSDSSFRATYLNRLAWERDAEGTGLDTSSLHDARLSPSARQIADSNRPMRPSLRTHSSRGKLEIVHV